MFLAATSVGWLGGDLGLRAGQAVSQTERVVAVVVDWVTHLVLSQVPHFDNSVVSAGHYEMLLVAVPADDVDVTLMCVADRYFACGARRGPDVPDTQRSIHRTRAEHLQRPNQRNHYTISQTYVV